MKIALCHLSDLHIKTPSDPILTRAKAILSAVRPRLSKDVAPLLVCSGDIAYSGGKAQYDLAHSFIAEMQTALNEMGDRNLLGTIVVPGNHDCDFSAAGDARPHLISGIGSAIDEADLRGESMQDLLKVHNNFFDFAQKLANPPPLKHDRIGWTVSYQHDGGTILVRCLNTALLSRKEEVPAQLRFPLKAIPDRSGDSDFALTLFHHPYAWPPRKTDANCSDAWSPFQTSFSLAMSTMVLHTSARRRTVRPTMWKELLYRPMGQPGSI